MITVIPDISFVYQMINFLVLLFILNTVLYKPIRNVILERKAKVEGLEDGVEKASSDLDSQKDAYKNGLKEARGEGLKKKEAFIDEASAQEKEIIEQINKKAQANLAQIKQQVAQETEQARKALEAEVDAYAKAIGEKNLGEGLLMKKMNWKKHLKVSGAVVAMLGGTAVAWAAGGGGHGEVHNSWLTVDTWKFVNFGLLAAGVYFIARKPVAQFFTSRAKGIEEELGDLEKKKADAEKKLAEYETRFRNLEQESEQIVADYIKQGEAAKERILAEAEAQAEKLEDMAKRNIEQEFKAAKAALQQEIAEKAMAQAEAVIKESISAEDQDRLVDEYLKKVEA